LSSREVVIDKLVYKFALALLAVSVLVSPMPATTLGQLQAALATSGTSNSGNYIEPGANFVNAMNEIGPRVYALGYWKDLVAEQVYLGADGYISLDRDAEAVLFANINDRPQKVFSSFHDMSALGNTPFLPDRYGLVDMNYAAIKRELTSIQGVDSFDDATAISTLHLVKEDNSPVSDTDITGGSIVIRATTEFGIPITGVTQGTTELTVTFSQPVMFFDEVRGVNLPLKVLVRTDPDDSETTIAEVLRGSDLVRYRRFRVGGARDATYVHVLIKRAWLSVSATSDIVWLGNISAWKHALLGKLAEDNADVERANYHWAVCKQMLEDEKDASRGAAIPKLDLDLVNGSGYAIHNLY
jgi:hypothetical protein